MMGVMRIRSAAVAATALVLAGCQTNPQTASIVAQPNTPVVKNITSFSNSLRCMDDLFLAYGKRNIVITSDGLPDATGQISAGTKDMMITTLSKMSERSSAFQFIDIEQGGAVDFIQNTARQGFALPDFYIRGAITQVDRNVASDSHSAGVALPFVSLGYSADQMLSVVTIDMNIGDVVKRQIIPGLHTTNTITVVARGQGADAEGIIQKASLFFEISQDRSQGTHQSVRTLIELGLMEVLGKLTKVPYWRCLQLSTTDPTVIEQARGWYDAMPPDEQVRVVQRGLAQTGDYAGPADGVLSAELREAVNRYKAQNDLIADGRVDFDLYYRLLADNRAVVPTAAGGNGGGAPAPAAAAAASAASAAQPPGYRALDGDAPPVKETPGGRDPIGLTLVSSAGGNGARVPRDSLVSLTVTTRRDAQVYCYYEYAEGNSYRVARIFPNRWQRDGRVSAGRPVTVPGTGAGFTISPAEPGVDEQVSCVAVGKPYEAGKEPRVIAEDDLTPLVSAKRLFQVIDQHLTADRVDSSVQTLKWTVR